MGSRIDTSLVLDALLMALWRRQPRAPVMVHFYQCCQFIGHEWQTFLRDHNLVSSMSRRGNCHDNAVAQSLFQLLTRERLRRRVHAMQPVMMRERTSSTASKCSTAHSAVIHRRQDYHL